MRLENHIYNLDYLNSNDLLLEEINKSKKDLKNQFHDEELPLISFYIRYDFEEDRLVVGALKV